MSTSTVAPAPSRDRARPDPAAHPQYRSIGALAVLGTVLLGAGSLLHPADADASVAADAFAEYAGVTRAHWVGSHLLQLGGVACVALVVVLLSRAVAGPRQSAWARVTAVLGTAGLATAAVLQAVDGIALKVVVDQWSAAGEGRAELFAAAVAVRSVEIGLAAVFALVLGAAAVALGVVLLTAEAGSRSLGALAVAAAAAAGANGIAIALTGFSATAMAVVTVSGVLTPALMLLVAGWAWGRRVEPRS